MERNIQHWFIKDNARIDLVNGKTIITTLNKRDTGKRYQVEIKEVK